MRAAGIAIHSTTRRTALLLLLTLAMSAASGGLACNRAKPEAAAADRLEGPPEKVALAWEEREIPGAPQSSAPVMIKEGPAPLAYLSERAATLQVVDRTGDAVLAQGAVGPRTIVVVDAQRGVVFGGRTLAAGPLPTGRQYAIYVVPDGGSVSRVGVSRPVKRQQEEPADGADAEAARPEWEQ